MYFDLSQKLISAYNESGKNPNYSLTFILNSIDPDTCTIGMDIVEHFNLSGDITSFDIDDHNVRALKALFGNVDAMVVEKMLWVAFLFPEI